MKIARIHHCRDRFLFRYYSLDIEDICHSRYCYCPLLIPHTWYSIYIPYTTECKALNFNLWFKNISILWFIVMLNANAARFYDYFEYFKFNPKQIGWKKNHPIDAMLSPQKNRAVKSIVSNGYQQICWFEFLNGS